MLQLEPSEAAKVRLAKTSTTSTTIDADIINELDTALRDNKQRDARALADRLILQTGLGLSAHDCKLLAEAATYLSERRYYRGKRIKH